LKRLASIYADAIGNILDGKFIDLIVNTRNYYTHYNESLKDKIAKSEELPMVNAKLDIIVKACLMKEMGFELPEIKDMMRRNRHTQRLL
jgi:ApeA N-terminal domain 1